ncbi:MAG: gamma-glutamylcyclotransferase family protein [Myxococcota bacterium]
MNTSLFVYGTLMQGQDQEGLLAGCERIAATTRGRLYDLPAGYPALSLQGADRVYGELVRNLDVRRLVLLDDYEGVDQGLYERVEIEVHVGLKAESAWAYVMDDPRSIGGRRIVKGRWQPSRRRG